MFVCLFILYFIFLLLMCIDNGAMHSINIGPFKRLQWWRKRERKNNVQLPSIFFIFNFIIVGGKRVGAANAIKKYFTSLKVIEKIYQIVCAAISSFVF